MIKVIVKDRKGATHKLEGPTDMNMNVMELCRAHELPVQGTCGGMAMCASCQIYVHSKHSLREMSEDEEMMLDDAFFVEDNSRLGCQIQLSDDLDGLEIELAPESE
jgi:ferredoxin